MSNEPGMPDLRRKLGCANAQLAQLTSRLRRNEIDGLFTSGKINKPQHDQLLTQFCNPNHVALSLSNEAFGNAFDQAIALLSQNDAGLYGEQTGPQYPDLMALDNTLPPEPSRDRRGREGGTDPHAAVQPARKQESKPEETTHQITVFQFP